MRPTTATVRAAIDAGFTPAEIERNVLSHPSLMSDQAAALWLYACAYETLRPTEEQLAERWSRPAFLRLRPARRRRVATAV
jgi:hypothetical protein